MIFPYTKHAKLYGFKSITSNQDIIVIIIAARDIIFLTLPLKLLDGYHPFQACISDIEMFVPTNP